jgi:hypothetical protein
MYYFIFFSIDLPPQFWFQSLSVSFYVTFNAVVTTKFPLCKVLYFGEGRAWG